MCAVEMFIFEHKFRFVFHPNHPGFIVIKSMGCLLLSRFCMNMESLYAPPSLLCPSAASSTCWGPCFWCRNHAFPILSHSSTATGEIRADLWGSCCLLTGMCFSLCTGWSVKRPTHTMWSSLRRRWTEPWQNRRASMGRTMCPRTQRTVPLGCGMIIFVHIQSYGKKSGHSMKAFFSRMGLISILTI